MLESISAASLIKIHEHYGFQKQDDQTIEECQELINEIDVPAEIYYDDTHALEVAGEVADVMVMCLQQAIMGVGLDKVEEIMRFKINRQLKRIAEEAGNE